jgi:DNA primase
MRIGYAPGACLRRQLTGLGYSLSALRRTGLVTAAGRDAFSDRIVFPLQGNLYGRSRTPSPAPHRFLPGSKGGLYGWPQARCCPTVILVEGLFDYAALWEAGFRNVTSSLGTHLNTLQLRQLCDAPRSVYITFDADRNGSGQHAAHRLGQTLRLAGISIRIVGLPDGHDPNSFFAAGGDAAQFQALLEGAAQ